MMGYLNDRIQRIEGETMTKKPNNKSLLFFALVSLAVLYWFSTQDIKGLWYQVTHANSLYLILAVASMLVYMTMEAGTLHLMVKHYDHHGRFTDDFKLAIATLFFNGITPFSTGGQPFQIYILSKRKRLDTARATSASIQNFIAYQLVLVMMGLFALIWGLPIAFQGPYGSFLSITIGVGFALNVGVVLLLLAVAYSEKITNRLLMVAIWALHFFKSPQAIQNKRTSWQETIELFHDNVLLVLSRPISFLKVIGLNVIKLLSLYLITFLVLKALGIEDVSLISALGMSACVMLITSMIPIPGASGGAEAGFTVMFGLLIGKEVAAVMILWRAITYYLGILVGMVVYYSNFAFKKGHLM